MNQSKRADLSLAAVALVWGSTFVLVKHALDDISTLLFLTLRFGIAAIVLALVFGRAKRNAGEWRLGLRGGAIAGCCLFAGYILQTFGLRYTTASKAGFLTGLYIPLVPMMSAAYYRKLPVRAEVLGVAAAAMGMALMTLDQNTFAIGKGDLLVMGCAVAYAIHILVLGHWTRRVESGLLTFGQIGTGALIGALTFWWAEPVRWQGTPPVWTALAVTSLLATALAFLVMTWAQRYTTPTRAALIFSLEPVFAGLTGWFVAGEVLSARQLGGAALILAGILLVELKPSLMR